MRTRAGLLIVAAALLVTGCPEKKVIVKKTPTIKKVIKIRPAESFYNEGMTALEAKQEDRALALFDEAIQKYKGDDAKLVDAHYNSGVVLMKRGDLEGARKSFSKAIELDPKHRDALLNLGVVLKRQKKYKQAIEHYRKALELVPRDPLIMNNLIVAYRLDKQYKQAEKTGHKLLARAPTNVEAYKNMTLIYYDQKKYKMAELLCINAGKMLEKLRKKDPSIPEDPGIYNNLGMIYIGLKRFRDAQTQFEKALTIDPDYTEALINIAAMAHRFRDYDRAKQAYEKVLAKDPKNLKAVCGLAYTIYGMGDAKRALEYFEKVLSRQPDDLQSIYTVGVIYDSLLKDYGNAVKYYEQYKTRKGSVPKEDPVHNRLQAARARLEMATQLKAEQEAEERKQREEEEKKRKALEAGKEVGQDKAGQKKLQDLIDAGAQGEEGEGGKPEEGEGAEGEKTPGEKATEKPAEGAEPGEKATGGQPAEGAEPGEKATGGKPAEGAEPGEKATG
ncbi:MAG: tetratricopeptide repeat protein, partial [Deltaproteobacteria bacterium]|nr:tetratricopeptide repeat protein [Deltaproteobacteria bacterium]